MVLILQDAFKYGGKRYTRAVNRYIVGFDLGASMDPTALCVQVEPQETRTPNKQRGRLDQDVKVSLAVVHLERLRLDTNYVDIVGYIAELTPGQCRRSASPSS